MAQNAIASHGGSRVGEVVYLAWLAVIAFAWVVVPMLLLLAGR